jgi:hypothetical protein
MTGPLDNLGESLVGSSFADRSDGIVKKPYVVTPAFTGVRNPLKQRDPRRNGDGERIVSATFYDFIK